jgi:uncharacterized protein (DUF1684 family)
VEPLLELADYRERVVALYRDGPQDGEDGWRDWRRRRDELLATHPQSPLAAGARTDWFPYDPAAVVRTRPVPAEGELTVETGGEDGAVRYSRVARLETPYGPLTLFWLRQYGGGLFLPVRDGTSGAESYGGGRYLTDTAKGTFGRGLRLRADGTAILDFNYLYNPSCAYDARWLCPLAPPENRVGAPIRAGERLPIPTAVVEIRAP